MNVLFIDLNFKGNDLLIREEFTKEHATQVFGIFCNKKHVVLVKLYVYLL